MNLTNKVALLIGGLLALGLFLGGAAGVILEASKPKRPDQSLLPRFKVVYFLEERPAVAPIGQIPEGATFYISPASITTVAEELSGASSVALDIDNHSKSKAEEEIYLEITDGSTIERFYYFAGRNEIAPLGYSRVDGETLSVAVAAGLKLSLLAVLFGVLLLWASRRSGREEDAHGTE
jgi:hypothetical protein